MVMLRLACFAYNRKYKVFYHPQCKNNRYDQYKIVICSICIFAFEIRRAMVLLTASEICL